MLRSIAKLLSSPVAGLVITTLIAVVLYFMAEKEVAPKYSITRSQTLAEIVKEEPKLQIFWDGKFVPNVRSVQIAIWNAGSQYLDVAAISKTDPIAIHGPNGAYVLYAKVISTSRPALKVSLSEEKDLAHDLIKVDFPGDEALEKNDGFVARVVYSAALPGDFYVSGRIKGAKQGLERVSWETVASKDLPSYIMYVFVGLMIVVLILASNTVYVYAKRLVTDRSTFCYFCFGNGILGIAVALYAFYKYLWPFFFGLPWLVSLK